MPLIEWKETFSVKNDDIDAQHQKLIEMINDMHDAMKTGKGSEAVAEIIDEMKRYTVYHFETEEKLMEEAGYPELKEHREEHQHFNKKVNEFCKEMKKSKAGLSMQVMSFLADWMRKHFLEVDQKYVPYINK